MTSIWKKASQWTRALMYTWAIGHGTRDWREMSTRAWRTDMNMKYNVASLTAACGNVWRRLRKSDFTKYQMVWLDGQIWTKNGRLVNVPKGCKRDQNGQPKCFWPFGTLLDPSGPFWTISNKNRFFAPEHLRQTLLPNPFVICQLQFCRLTTKAIAQN